MCVRNLAWLTQHHGERLAVRIGDVRDEEAIANAVRGARAVLHLAAQVAVTTSVDDPVEDFEINARGTLNVLEAVRRLCADAPGALRFHQQGVRQACCRWTIWCATACVMFRCDACACERVRRKRRRCRLYSPYGCSQGRGRSVRARLCAHLWPEHRAFSAMSCLYGPHQFGNEDQGWVAHFLISALRGEPISIYGDGYQVRDVLYVDDAVARMAAGSRQHRAPSRDASSISAAVPKNTISLHELLHEIEHMEGGPPAVSFR